MIEKRPGSITRPFCFRQLILGRFKFHFSATKTQSLKDFFVVPRPLCLRVFVAKMYGF